MTHGEETTLQVTGIRSNDENGFYYWQNGAPGQEIYDFPTNRRIDPPEISDPEIRAIVKYYPMKGGVLTAGKKQTSKETTLDILFEPDLDAYETREELSSEFIEFAAYFYGKYDKSSPYQRVTITLNPNKPPMLSAIVTLTNEASLDAITTSIIVMASDGLYESALKRSYWEHPIFSSNDSDVLWKQKMKEIEDEFWASN